MFEGYPLKMIARFDFYHAANPQVYAEFCRMAKQIRNAGKRTYGARCLLENIRYNHDLTTTDEDVFKVNNDLIPMFARKFMVENPKYAGLFNLRAVTSKGKMSNEEYERKAKK